MSPDIHTLQEAAVILKQARIDVAAGSLAVWRKVDSALRYINSQIEVELADVGNDPLFTVDIADEAVCAHENTAVDITEDSELFNRCEDCGTWSALGVDDDNAGSPVEWVDDCPALAHGHGFGADGRCFCGEEL